MSQHSHHHQQVPNWYHSQCLFHLSNLAKNLHNLSPCQIWLVSSSNHLNSRSWVVLELHNNHSLVSSYSSYLLKVLWLDLPEPNLSPFHIHIK
jgi:hypothetical protein